jgi:hypothetical protein
MMIIHANEKNENIIYVIYITTNHNENHYH